MCASVFAQAKTDTRAPLERPRYLRGAYIMNHKKLLLTLTLCLCALLCMVVTASASEVQNTGSHSHELCKKTVCTNPEHIKSGTHGSVTFATELRQDGNTLYIGADKWEYDSVLGSYMLGAGTYYLSTDLTLDHRIQISDSNGGSVVLCLNGKTISCTTGKTIQIKSMNSKDLTFTLCDCKGGGMITHAEDSGNGSGVDVAYSNNDKNTDVAKFIMYNGCITQNKGSGVYLNANTAFTMYGGNITQNGYNDTSIFGGYGGGVCVASEASFTMYGGNITGNYANKNGGGVYVNADKTFVMYGGSITGNHTAGSGGGVNVNAGTMIVGGNVNISGNWQGNENSSISNNNANNVYLSAYDSSSKFATITIEKALTGENSSIGVTTATPVATTKDASVKIAAGKGTHAITDADKGHFTPDTGYCEVQKKDDGALYLTHVHSGGEATCTAAAKCGGCSQPYGNIDPNNHDLTHHDAQPATCTAKGWEAYDTCSRCGYTTKVEKQKTPHTYGAVSYTWATDNTTCKAEHKCTACQHVENETVNTQQTVTQNRSCTLNELSTFTATFTNTAFARQKEENVKTADMTGHTYSATEWKSNVDNHWHECAVCNTQIDKAEHDWRDATYTAPKTCTVCGATTGTKLSAYYYYSPAKTEDTPASPKAGDPGVLLYAGLALASLTGLACTAKKRH